MTANAPTLATICYAAITVASLANDGHAAGDKLYGVHWWDYSNPTVGDGPQGGWSTETIVTESDPWWHASYFVPLYQQVSTTHNAALITRIDYDWGQTVPAPANSSAGNWANKILSDVIGPLGAYAQRWVIGNEPNLTGEGTDWPANQITPFAYAQLYHTIRTAIKAQRPNDEVLFAPVSPGGVIPGVRWKDGNQWLAEAIDATLAMRGGDIDGFAIHAYGDPNSGAAQAVAEFRAGYTSQLAVIDQRPLSDVPVYITEWNRATSTTGNLAANEQVTADFIRQSLADVEAWNRTPGNHNIRAITWFVDNDYGGWEPYSLEWWQTRGNPAGHSGDLSTALLTSSDLPAGLVGTRPAGDYNGDGETTVDDLAEWRARFGRTDSPFADGNRNGVVDAADYVVWRKNFQPSAGGADALAHVPEPISLTYLLVGFAAMGWRGSHEPGSWVPVADGGKESSTGASPSPTAWYDSAQGATMQPLRVLESCLSVTDLDAAERFYTQVIGLQHARENGRHVFFRCGDGMVLIFNPEKTSTVPSNIGGAPVPLHGSRGAGHLAFAVRQADIPAWRSRLERCGVEIESEVRWPQGGTSLYIRDPAGNSIELASPTIWGLPPE